MISRKLKRFFYLRVQIYKSSNRLFFFKLSISLLFILLDSFFPKKYNFISQYKILIAYSDIQPSNFNSISQNVKQPICQFSKT